jgi:fumarate hydratase, class II
VTSPNELQPPWWGPSTELAIANFPISRLRMDRTVLAWLADIKVSAAIVNAELGVLDPDVAYAIQVVAADIADRLRDGDLLDQFPVDIFQTGSGTSSNMNVNEVVARLASRDHARVRPNDDVNASQSSNDVFVSAGQLAADEIIRTRLVPAADVLLDALERLAERAGDTVTIGRTHLMDAVPIAFADVVGAWRANLSDALESVTECSPLLRTIPLGGTAVGTGLNAPERFGDDVAAELSARRGVEIGICANRFAGISTRHTLERASASLRELGLSFAKLADDIRWLASGPVGGINELHLAPLQPGSSMMPGKVNPVLCESALQVVAAVVGMDAAVTYASRLANFQLHAGTPLIVQCVCTSSRWLASSMRLFAHRVLPELSFDPAAMAARAASSGAIVTALAPAVGYDVAAHIVERALQSSPGDRLIDAIVTAAADSGYDPDHIRTLLDVTAMARPFGHVGARSAS